ncbi:MAG: AAA family ATPase [Bacteroidetes bacterium]|nr:AAA family ATPase [Bacteroidota bacterium]
MELKTASRKRAKIKMALQGPSGSGKTMSALLLAYGLCNQWSKVAVIDTENHSAELYSHLGKYNVVNIGAPYTPEKYCEAIRLCENAGMEVIIIDSISHEWDSSGGILDVHGNMAGNSFTNWSKLTPRHNAFIQTILQSSTHIIATIRSKQDYVLQEKNGKMVPEKVGLKGVTRDGIDYEFTLVLDIDIKHNATANKDRTGLFSNQPEFKITAETGAKILAWCNSGVHVNIPQANVSQQNLTIGLSMKESIERCSTMQELIVLYNEQSTETKTLYQKDFAQKRDLLKEAMVTTNPITHIQKPQHNGSTSPTTK